MLRDLQDACQTRTVRAAKRYHMEHASTLQIKVAVPFEIWHSVSGMIYLAQT